MNVDEFRELIGQLSDEDVNDLAEDYMETDELGEGEGYREYIANASDDDLILLFLLDSE